MKANTKTSLDQRILDAVAALQSSPSEENVMAVEALFKEQEEIDRTKKPVKPLNRAQRRYLMRKYKLKKVV